jgi:hypothetical protein
MDKPAFTPTTLRLAQSAINGTCTEAETRSLGNAVLALHATLTELHINDLRSNTRFVLLDCGCICLDFHKDERWTIIDCRFHDDNEPRFVPSPTKKDKLVKRVLKPIELIALLTRISAWVSLGIAYHELTIVATRATSQALDLPASWERPALDPRYF